jgi:hypothetical protein
VAAILAALAAAMQVALVAAMQVVAADTAAAGIDK